jgi:uncharacterized Tic20 family protein
MSNETPQPPSPATPSVPSQPLTAAQRDERMWAMFCHLAALVGYVIPFPFASVVGPLVVWMIKREQYPLVQDQGKESVNFQISMAIYAIGALILIFIVIGVPILIGLAIFDLVCIIIATMKANEGVAYRYPLCIRFIK